MIQCILTWFDAGSTKFENKEIGRKVERRKKIHVWKKSGEGEEFTQQWRGRIQFVLLTNVHWDFSAFFKMT